MKAFHLGLKTGLLVLLFILWIGVEAAFALPRFALREGVHCVFCHVNPSGAGMRNETGNLYTGMILPLRPSLRAPEEQFTPEISDFLALGTDFRVLGYDDDRGTTSFFPMQADFYLSATLTEKITLYYDQGFRRGLDLNNFETFALAQVLPLSGYVKVGKFIPAFGWKLDNHTAFIRGGNSSASGAGQVTDGTSFSQLDKDVGVEVGFYPGQASIQLAVLNGGRGSTSDFDNNKDKAVSSRADYLFDFEFLRASVGGSFYQSNESASLETIYAVHFGANWSKLTYFGEIDWESLDDAIGQEGSRRGVRRTASYHELDYLAVRGVDLKVVYEFIDPDREIANDALTRVTGGIEFFPGPHQEIRLEYRHTFGNRVVNPDADLNEILLMYHIFF